MTEKKPVRVLFVCLGNICRSPLAEGIFSHQVQAFGLSDAFEIDSAGTGSWHVGDRADRRMRKTAERHGVPLTSRARQFGLRDLEAFDHILAMDKSNLHDILFLDAQDQFGERVRLFREWDPAPGDFQVPDPYYGGPDGFEDVYRIVERTSQALLDHLIEIHGLKPR